jgi:hypothetical protein
VGGKSVDITPAAVSYCTVMASQAAHGIYKYLKSNVLTIPFNATASDPLVVSETQTGIAGTQLLVAVSGGNGGPISYSYSGSGCVFTTSGSELRVNTSGPAYCTVQAKQNAFAQFRSTISNAKTIVFAQSDAPGTLTVTNSDADAGSPLLLTSNASSLSSTFASQVKFKVSGTAACGNMTGDKTSITASGEAWCSVTAYWPANGVFRYQESTPKTIHFLTYEQGNLTINNAAGTTSANKNGSISITTKGGSGSGLVSFATRPGDGCSFTALNGTAGTVTLKSNDNTARTCTVTATKAALGRYKSATSQSVVFTFKAA